MIILGDPETYPEIAEILGVEICTGCDTIYHPRDAGGSVRFDRRGVMVVHWRDRAVNVAGLKRFLGLAGEALYGPWDSLPEWQRVFTKAKTISGLAKRIHRRIPLHLYDVDRARLKFLLHDVPDWQKRHWDDNTRDAYRRATRWAYRN